MGSSLLYKLLSTKALRAGWCCRCTWLPCHHSLHLLGIIASVRSLRSGRLVRWRSWSLVRRGIRPLSRVRSGSQGTWRSASLLRGAVVNGRPKVDVWNVVASIPWHFRLVTTADCLENSSARSLHRLFSFSRPVGAGIVDAVHRRAIIVVAALAAPVAALSLRWRRPSVRVWGALADGSAALVKGIVVDNLISCHDAARRHG